MTDNNSPADTAAPAPVSCTFTTPIPYGAGVLEGLTFRRLAAGDLRGLALEGIQSLDTDLYLAIAARAATTPITVQQLEAMAAADLSAMMQAIIDIMQGAGQIDGSAVTLHRPISRADGDIEKLAFRAPTAGDLRGLQMTALMNLDVSALLTLAQRCSTTRVDAADLAGIDASDIGLIGAVLLNFFV